MTKQKIINDKTKLFTLAWPIFIELLLHMLIGNMDSIMLSRFSDNAVASIGNVNQILNLISITFNIIASATAVLVAQYLGSKNNKKISEIYSVAIYFNLAFSIIVSLALSLLSNQIFKIMNLPPELYADAKTYIQIVGGFIFLQAAFMTFSAIFRSNGLMKATMFISMGVNVLNIIGNYLFLYGKLGFPVLGVKGVAISSVFSRLVGLLIVFYMFYKYVDGKISFKYLKPFPKETFTKLIRVGIPSAGESMSWNVSQAMILSFINILGTVVVSTRIYSTMLSWFSFLYVAAVSQATQIIVGHLVGAGEEDKAYHRVLKTLRPAVIIAIIVAMISWLVSPYTFRIFTDNQDIIDLGMKVLFIDIFLEIGRAFNLVIISSMRAAGDVKYPVYIGVASMWGVSALFSYILGITFGLGLVGIWIAMCADEWVRAVLVYIRWKKGGWRGKRLAE